MSNNVKKMVAVMSLLSLFLSCFVGCSSSKGAKGSDGIHVALTGNSFSKEFIELFNPLYAQNETEYAAGLLVAPSIMRYEEGKGWIPVLGNITVSTQNGKTVATIDLDKSIRYSNQRKLSSDEYIRTVKMLVRTNYNGYFKDFYTYPIEGLVACRYNCRGLTLADLPDFDALLADRFAVILGEDLEKAEKAYEALLSETNIFGCYDGNPQTVSPDGRTFREVLEQDSRKAPDDAYFVAGDLKWVMLADLCKLYAQKDRSQWMIDELKVCVMQQLQDAFEEECLRKGGKVNGAISGITRNSTTSLTVTFERVIEDEDRVIEMLNLPMLYSFMDQKSKVIGAGAYSYSGSNEGRNGKMVSLLAADGKSLYLHTAEQQDVYATIYMGQLSAAAIDGAADEDLVKKYGLQVKTIGGKTVVYDKGQISEKELSSIAVLFG